MTLDEMKARETGNLWQITWRPDDWADGYALFYVLADTESAALEAMGLTSSDVQMIVPGGFGGVIIA